MTKTKTASFLGFVGHAATVALARKVAEDMAIRFVRDTREHNPAYIKVSTMAAIVWRAPSCWTFTLVSGSETRHRGEIPHVMFQGDDVSFFDTVDCAIRHVAQLAWSHIVVDDVKFFTDAYKANRPSRMPNSAIEDSVVECVRWAKWQRGYKAGMDSGLDDNAARCQAEKARYAVEPSDVMNAA